MDADLDVRTALELAAAIRRRELSPTEVMEATLTAVEQRNPALNAVIWLDDDDARARAQTATERIAREGAEDLPPFFGVPLPVKDLSPVAGWPNTLGSAGADDAPAEETALVVERLEEAGFLLCGRTNSPEFGLITATENERYGITRNPWDLDRTPGGSSGGASAAVAGGMFTVAHGGDGGGSIRIPASCTGLVGLKPSRGRVPGWTVSWEGADVDGVLTRTVGDAAAVLDVIAQPDPLAWWNAPVPQRPFAEEPGTDQPRLRVLGTTAAPLGVEVDPECVRAVERALAILADAGHEIVEARFEPHAREFAAHFGDVVDAGLADKPVDWDRVHPYSRTSRDRAAAVDSLSYVSAVAGLQRWSRKMVAQWGGQFDLLVTPTMAIQPPPAGQMLREITQQPGEAPSSLLATVMFTSIFNMSGLPAISLPVHTASDTGLPVGAQLVAGPWQEDLLLRLAAQVEAALPPWEQRRPDLAAVVPRNPA